MHFHFIHFLTFNQQCGSNAKTWHAITNGQKPTYSNTDQNKKPTREKLKQHSEQQEKTRDVTAHA